MTTPATIDWILPPAERVKLLAQHPPTYPKVVAHHVTLAADAADRPVPRSVRAAIVGRSDDLAGGHAMVVTIDGDSGRPDGSTFHIAWSLGEGRRARESNDVIQKHGWSEFDHPIAIALIPARL